MNNTNIRKAMLDGGAHSIFLSGDANDTIALDEAKNLLCMNADENGKSCSECKSCDMFDAQSHPDFLLIGLENSSIKIGEVRELSQWVSLKPIYNSKVILILRSQQMTEQAQNALLKTLEEPPDSVYFILSGDERQMLQTIRSRITIWMDADNQNPFDPEIIKTANEANECIESKNWTKLSQIFSIVEDASALLNCQIVELRDSALSKLGIQRINDSSSSYSIDLFKSEKIIRRLIRTANEIEKSANKNLALDALIVELSRIVQ